MKKLFSGNIKPYIFHMSWTRHKFDKMAYLQQIGDWFVKETCIASTSEQILQQGSQSLAEYHPSAGNLVTSCCSIEPIFKCHYSDMASRSPECKDAHCPTINAVHSGSSRCYLLVSCRCFKNISSQSIDKFILLIIIGCNCYIQYGIALN
jgi:hypothetical protein